MTTKDELLEQLLVERLDNTWWRYQPPPRKATEPVLPLRPAGEWTDDEVTCRRRQRELLDAVKHVPIKENEEEETA